jgi:hypothetical protein
MTPDIQSDTTIARALSLPAPFNSIPAETLLPRRQAAKALTDRGIPISAKTLSTKACRGGGPPYQLFGKIALYRWGDLALWALAKMGTPARSAVEHKAKKAPAKAPAAIRKDAASHAGVEAR